MSDVVKGARGMGNLSRLKIARILLVLAAAPFLCAMSARLPFTGTVDGTGETFSGWSHVPDYAPFVGEVRLVTSSGATCLGPFRHLVGVHSKAELTCSDGRRAEFNLRIYGPYVVTYGSVGEKRAVFTLPTLPTRHRSW
jgi:hypothetical protein